MKPSNSFVSSTSATLFLTLIAIGAIFLTSCGNSSVGGGVGGGTGPTGSTEVVLLMTSTSNDQLTEFNIGIASVALTDSKGNVTTIFTAPANLGTNVEWMHLNGATEPFLIANLPQGTYTAAQITAAGCSFTNVTYSTNLTTSTYDQGACAEGTNTTTVTLPAPISVTGSAMALSLNLQVGSSWTLQLTQPFATYTIDPKFTLTPITLAATPTNETNGLITGVTAQVSSIATASTSATITLNDGQPFTVKPSATAVYQGVSSFSALAMNQIVNLDLAIQPDGSLMATRVEVDDASSSYADIGSYLTPDSPLGTVSINTTQPEGCPDYVVQFECTTLFIWDTGSTFGVSGQFTNIASIPLSAPYSASTLTPGQYASGSIVGSTGIQNLPYAQVVTLEPQTLNGTVESVSNQNGLAVYTVALAAYDIFSVTQQEGGSYLPKVTDPSTVVVYVDTSAQFLNSGMVEEGSLLRFRGVVFNDNGTLRMDCDKVLDGVTE
jgi:hypothetical protein